MSNTIQIKRGSGKPNNKLAPYELGIDITDGQLYYGGSITNSEYGEAQGIKVAKAEEAEGAIKIVDENGSECSVGSSAGPIYLSNGKFLPCGGDTTIPGTIDYAKALNPGATIITNLEKNNAVIFTGAENSQTIIGATGVLPISKGGTGATTAATARTNLGAAAANHTHDYLPLSGGTLTGVLTLHREDNTNNGLNCSNSNLYNINSLKFADTANSAGEGILFPRTNSTSTWDGIWALNGELKFTTNYGNSSTDHTIVHTGNHFTAIATSKDISGTKTFTTETAVSEYTGFIFMGYTSSNTGNSDDDGWASLTVPANFITRHSDKRRKFVMGHAEDSKSFTVVINQDNTMTVTGVSSIGGGISANNFWVYGIK